jgi:hypothetical protein
MGKGLMTKIRVNHNDFLIFISGSRSVPGTNLTQFGFYQKVIKSFVLSASRAFRGLIEKETMSLCRTYAPV